MKTIQQSKTIKMTRVTAFCACLSVAGISQMLQAQWTVAERNAMLRHLDQQIRQQEQHGMHENANKLRQLKQQALGAPVSSGTESLPTYQTMPRSSLNSYTSPQALAAFGQLGMTLGNAISQSIARQKAREELDQLQHQYHSPDQFPGRQNTAQRALEELQRQYQEMTGRDAEARQQQSQIKSDLADLEKLQEDILKNISAANLDPKLFNLQDFPELAELQKEIKRLEDELDRMDQVLGKLPPEPQNIMKSWEGGVWNEETQSWDTHKSDVLLWWGKDGVGRWAEKDQVVWLSGQSGSEALASLSGGKSKDPMQKYIIKADNPKHADGFDWHEYSKDHEQPRMAESGNAVRSETINHVRPGQFNLDPKNLNDWRIVLNEESTPKAPQVNFFPSIPEWTEPLQELLQLPVTLYNYETEEKRRTSIGLNGAGVLFEADKNKPVIRTEVNFGLGGPYVFGTIIRECDLRNGVCVSDYELGPRIPIIQFPGQAAEEKTIGQIIRDHDIFGDLQRSLQTAPVVIPGKNGGPDILINPELHGQNPNGLGTLMKGPVCEQPEMPSSKYFKPVQNETFKGSDMPAPLLFR